MKLLTLFLFVSFSSFASDLILKEFDYRVTDITEHGFTKEALFKKMNRKLIRTKDSICSNRSLMWGYDFKVSHGLNTPNIFLFYTARTGDVGPVTWWYHVTPIVNEAGNLFVMDAGYPNRIKAPMTIQDWLHEWNGKKSVCKEIKPGENDLVELMYKESAFPETTRYGKYNCYYKIVPPTYWTPYHLAKHILGKDPQGNPVKFDRPDFDKKELMEACIEASTTPMGWLWGTSVSKCRYFVYRGKPE